MISREGLNARDLTAADIGDPIGAVVADVSFISLRLVLPPALALAAPKAWGVFLVKPQFEVGRDARRQGRHRARRSRVAEQSANDIAAWLEREMRWTIVGVIPSPIAGGDGNREFLLGARAEIRPHDLGFSPTRAEMGPHGLGFSPTNKRA